MRVLWPSVATLCCMFVVFGNASAEPMSNSAIETLLKTVVDQYGEERANEVFREVVKSLESGGGDPGADPERLTKLIEEKLEEVKQHFSDPIALGGSTSNANVDRTRTEMATLSESLMKSIKDEGVGKETIAAATEVENARRRLTLLGDQVGRIAKQAERTLRHVATITKSINEKQALMKENTAGAIESIDSQTGKTMFRGFVYIFFIVELLGLTLFAAFRKFASRNKFDKLG